jgi:hypothetical protein
MIVFMLAFVYDEGVDLRQLALLPYGIKQEAIEDQHKFMKVGNSKLAIKQK